MNYNIQILVFVLGSMSLVACLPAPRPQAAPVGPPGQQLDGPNGQQLALPDIIIAINGAAPGQQPGGNTLNSDIQSNNAQAQGITQNNALSTNQPGAVTIGQNGRATVNSNIGQPGVTGVRSNSVIQPPLSSQQTQMASMPQALPPQPIQAADQMPPPQPNQAANQIPPPQQAVQAPPNQAANQIPPPQQAVQAPTSQQAAQDPNAQQAPPATQDPNAQQAAPATQDPNAQQAVPATQNTNSQQAAPATQDLNAQQVAAPQNAGASAANSGVPAATQSSAITELGNQSGTVAANGNPISVGVNDPAKNPGVGRSGSGINGQAAAATTP